MLKDKNSKPSTPPPSLPPPQTNSRQTLNFTSSIYLISLVSVVVTLAWLHVRLVSVEEYQRLHLHSSHLARVKRKVESGSGTKLNNAHVEFMNPRQRTDESSPAGNPEEGDTTGNDDWVWLTSYSRIPLLAIQEFCSATKDYCPPGAPGQQGQAGNPGKPGSKGDKGEHGTSGDPGVRGHQGPPGLSGVRGPRGEPGIPGLSGTDGRDGLPGEPGLDGIPGRNGLDGVPGIDGIPGLDGRPGTSGRNGTDGTPGSQGLQGPPGPSGPKGLPGSRGPPGISGTPGTPGIPGISAYLTNGTDGKLLIPPSIVGSYTKSRPLMVAEEENVRLRCSATGVPRPLVTWKRADGTPILSGAWKSSMVEGPVLNLTRVNRQHIGEYICFADNGVSPHVQKSYVVEVHFAPLIKIQNQHVGAVPGSNSTLECYVEAFPTAITYWERYEGRIVESSDKYQISTQEIDTYKLRMTLVISKVTQQDLGKYYCVSKNELGVTKGEFNVYELDPNQATPPPMTGTGVVKFGRDKPAIFDEELCPTPPPCKECPNRTDIPRCRSGGFALLDMVGWEMYPLGNLSHPEPNNRSQDCVLSAVGKPVFNRHSEPSVGAWMRDPVRSGADGDKYYVTILDEPKLYEYINKTLFQKSRSSRNFTLPDAFRITGNFHTLHNGSFYYVSKSGVDEKPRIIKIDLSSGKSTQDLELPYGSFNTESLYKSKHSWVDLSTDENGLWAIHTLADSNNTAIVKIDPVTMTIQYGWNITISHLHAGDMFIICGVLYAVDSVTERETKIRLALDLYRRQLLHKFDLQFANPFSETSFVSYNPRTKELFTWSKGNQLIYPIKYSAMEELLLN